MVGQVRQVLLIIEQNLSQQESFVNRYMIGNFPSVFNQRIDYMVVKDIFCWHSLNQL